MKKIFLLMLLLSALPTLISAQDPGEEPGGDYFSNIVGPFANWKGISVMIALVTVMLVALAYMAGKGFDMPEIRAWAASELSQAFVTVLIVIFMVAIVGFADEIARFIVNQSNVGFQCEDGDPCAIMTANAYLDGLIDSADTAALELAQDNIKALKQATRKAGGYAVPFIKPIPLLQLAIYASAEAGKIMDAERYGILYEYWINMLSILHAQKFFVGTIVFKFAPTVLAIGIVARAFFVTRKLGGLLMAIALGVMLVFPLMYIFNWITLNVTLFGDAILGVGGEPCPEICKEVPPLYYTTNGDSIRTTGELIEFLDLNDSEADFYWDAMNDLANGTIDEYTFDVDGTDVIVKSCENASYYFSPEGDSYCPYICRELPYPLSATCTMRNKTLLEAGNYTGWVEKACNNVPAECKVARKANISIDELIDVRAKCGDQCTIVPPLSPNCDVGDCLMAPHRCRIAYRDATGIRGGSCAEEAVLCLAERGVQEQCGQCYDLDRECRLAGGKTSDKPGVAYEVDVEIDEQCAQGVEECQYAFNCFELLKNCTRDLCINPAPEECKSIGNADPDICKATLDCAESCQNLYMDDSCQSNYTECGRQCEISVDASALIDDCKADCDEIPTPCEISCLETAAEDAVDQCISGCTDSIDPDELQACYDECDNIPEHYSEEQEKCEEAALCWVDCGLDLSQNNDLDYCLEQYAKCNDEYCGPEAKDCPSSMIAEESCVYVMPRPDVRGEYSHCDECIFIDTTYTFSPPIEYRCAQLCGEQIGGPPKVSPADFAKMSQEGMVGKSEIKSVAAMILPAYILPLLNITVTLMFIRTLSPMLGGDIEIPGMAKII